LPSSRELRLATPHRDRVQADLSALEDWRKAAAILLLSWLPTRLKGAVELEIKAMSTMLAAAIIEPNPTGHPRRPKPPFTRSIITSRNISPEIFEVVAVQRSPRRGRLRRFSR
jgi:hypothetical protein